MRSGWGRRVRAFTAALLSSVVVAGCAHAVGPQGGGAGGAAGASVTTTSAGSKSGSGAAGGGTKTAGGTGPARFSNGSGGGTATPAAGGSSSGATDTVANDARGNPGNLARALLQGARAATDVLEIMVQSGSQPSASSISHVQSVLADASHKHVSTSSVSLSGGGQNWTAQQLRAIADANTRQHQGGGQAVLHLLFVGGSYEGDTSVLGITVRADVIAVFEDQVQSATGPLGGSTIETAVVTHEVGHTLGLVGLVVKAAREDQSHPGHSTNQGSVMYWAIESDLVTQVLSGPPPTDFDNADRADLETIRTSG